VDPREERFRPLGRFLFIEVIVVAILGVLSLLLNDALATAAAAATLIVLVASPLIRVIWLVIRWFRRGDPRFAMVGVFVLCVPAVGFVLAR
jgi:hypothetical protein